MRERAAHARRWLALDRRWHQVAEAAHADAEDVKSAYIELLVALKIPPSRSDSSELAVDPDHMIGRQSAVDAVAGSEQGVQTAAGAALLLLLDEVGHAVAVRVHDHTVRLLHLVRVKHLRKTVG